MNYVGGIGELDSSAFIRFTLGLGLLAFIIMMSTIGIRFDKEIKRFIKWMMQPKK